MVLDWVFVPRSKGLGVSCRPRASLCFHWKVLNLNRGFVSKLHVKT